MSSYAFDSQRLFALLGPVSDAVWECDLRSGSFKITFSNGIIPSWFSPVSDGQLAGILSILEGYERRSLLRAWVRFLKSAAASFTCEIRMRTHPAPLQVRAVVLEFDQAGCPVSIAGTITSNGTELFLRSAIDSARDAIVVTDLLGSPVLVNAAAVKALGLPEGKAERHGLATWWETLRNAADDPVGLEHSLQRVLVDPHDTPTSQLRLSDGRVMECYVTSLFTAGRVSGRLWCFRDVTAEYRLNQQMRLANERLELGLLGTEDGVFDWNILTDEVYVSHLPGVPSSVNTREWVHPEDRERMDEATRAHLQDRVPYDVQFRSQLPGGPLKWVRARGRALRDPNGRPYRFVGCYTDITAYKQAVDALALKEQEYRTVLAEIHEVVFEADVDGMCSYLNPAWTQLLGYEIDKCIGSPLLDFVHPDDRDSVRLQLQDASSGGSPLESRWVTASGNTIWLELRPGRIGQESRRIFGTMVDVRARKAIQDATERARKAAEQASVAKSEFVATVSHELRTPLNAIIGSNELLSHSSLNTDQVRLVEMAGSNARILVRLIDDLLDISRIESGQIEMDMIGFDPVQALETVCDQFRMDARAKGLELELAVGALPARVVGDPHRVRQVLANLAGNAIKFTSAGKVTVKVERTGQGAIRYSVIDTGAGIPADAVRRIFEKFVQLPSGTSRPRAGVGLGLAISQSLVDRMGGRLWVETEAGKGSTFCFELPLAQANADETQARFPLTGQRVALWVRDEGLQDLLGRLLERADAGIVRCASARRLRQILGQRGCDAVLLDEGVATLKSAADVCRFARSHGVPVGELTGAGKASLTGCGAVAIDLPPTTARIVQLVGGAAGSQNARNESAAKTRPMQELRNPPKVLLVDDSPDGLAIGAAILHGCGYVVDRAGGGLEAVSKAAGYRYDLILMDIEMPDLDGLEATRRIRAAEAASGGSRVPIVALTAHAFAGHSQECKSAGMDDFQSKPITRQCLAAKAATWIPAAPAILCVGDNPEWTHETRRAIESDPRYTCLLADDAEQASSAFAKQRIALVLLDAKAASSETIQGLRRANPSIPFVLLSLQDPESDAYSEHIRWPGTPDHLLSVVERHVWVNSQPPRQARTGTVQAEIFALIPGYLDNRLNDVKKIRQAVDDGDFYTVERVAHNLKGSGAGFGFAALSALGRDMEKAAKDREQERIRSLNQELERQVLGHQGSGETN